MGVSIESIKNGSTYQLLVSGEVDVSNASELRDALEGALAEKPASLEVDLSQLPYIDSTGIGALVGAARRAAEASVSFSLSHPQRNVARVLSLLGVDAELGVKE